ncbi:MAG: uracil phosphoribosyltransferase [Chitinophagales bacterium]
MVYNLSNQSPIIGEIVSELRDVTVQNDRMRFRRNLERLGEIFAYEISKKLPTKTKEVQTPLGISECTVFDEQPVIATILRAGLPMHTGLLNMLDKADNGFISAYRKHHKSGKFTIKMEYISCPDLEGKIVILSDPMLATGASIVLSIKQLMEYGSPSHIHVVVAIASTVGIDEIRKNFSSDKVTIWTAAIDEELTAKGYIVPGLGDAGDLSFGEKLQD